MCKMPDYWMVYLTFKALLDLQISTLLNSIKVYNNWFASACAVWLMSVFYFVPRLILLIWNMEKRKILSLNSVCIHLILRFLSLTFFNYQFLLTAEVNYSEVPTLIY